MRKVLHSIRLLFVFCLWTLASTGQESNVVQFSIPEGLPQSQVNKILFDSRGMLWVATSGGGIASFDGNNFMTLDEKKGLAGNIVLDLEEDKTGRIYTISSWGGISVINKNSVEKVIPFPDEFTASSSLEKDAYGNIWMSGSRLYYLEGDEFVPVTTDISLPFVVPVNMKSLGSKLFVTSNNKLIVVDVEKKKQVFSKTYDFNIQVVLPIGEQSWYIGTANEGLYKEENGILTKVDLPISSLSAEISITDAYKENVNNYWFSSRNGAYHIQGSEVVYYEKTKGFDRYDCASICFDAQGNVWFGTRGEGVIGIVNTPFSYYKTVNGLNKSDNFPIYEDDESRIWAGNNEEGVFIYDGEKVINLTTKDGLTSNKVRSFSPGFHDEIIVGTGDGLSIINTKSLAITTLEDFDGQYVKVVKKRDSVVYVGTVGGGLYTINAKNEVNRLFEKELNSVSSIAFKKKQLLVGNGVGCYVVEDSSIQFIQNGLINTYVGNMAIDKNGKIWVGTDREIARLDGNEFTSYTEADGLTSALVYILYADQNGYLWVGTNKGLDRITLDNQSNIIKIRHFGYTEGFKGVEVNSNGVFENDKGELYFSTIEGIHKYMPSYDYSFSYNTPVYISGIKLFLEDFDFGSENGKENWFEVPESITLEHDQSHLTFEYFAVDYLNPTGVEYTYFLEGFDKKWSPPTKSRYAVYNNIPPGNYVFKVKQAGNEFSQTASINIYIKKPPPPFYKSVWFALLMLGVLALIIYYFTEYRTSKLRNQQLYLESKIEERTLEILESEKEKTVLLQEVHHRVKNNLQIIISLFRLQSHFTDNEEALDLFRNSQNRIRSMSKIHEKLYETKDLSKIEIKSYMIELVEDLVASYDINNEVTIEHQIQDCNINLDELTPLALIINEIITNSLKYGLREVDSPKIQIELSQNEVGFTYLKIADNGPGFDPDIWDNHQSMGVELIKTLTEQLDGEIRLSFEENHPIYELKFKASK
ncbi:histidine kinase dimerization/phosphoacceptor domain -containing protein [Parvicella tangerina]|uniref:histidine kinase n=1 Tax=Parvicella tangerina TaxID=2829795 RepID=A0A916NRG4_9FLAO|nr:histidine kinase dimerization/phosphoacceptor domain -containing protein [Parvicella tangerina]CAG5081158.1 hypothetical protein CRYO30217_01551 [Parvicella tangerina]